MIAGKYSHVNYNIAIRSGLCRSSFAGETFPESETLKMINVKFNLLLVGSIYLRKPANAPVEVK